MGQSGAHNPEAAAAAPPPSPRLDPGHTEQHQRCVSCRLDVSHLCSVLQKGEAAR